MIDRLSERMNQRAKHKANKAAYEENMRTRYRK